MIGRTLSHHTILEKLGSGGMGDVYVAEDAELARKVALKVLPTEMAESEERRARFKREAKAIASLNHPNIVHVYSVEEAEGVHFITMELVSGKTLSELIPKRGMPLGKFFEVAVPLADAVSEAIEPITTLKAKGAELIRRAKETGQPIIITQNGKATAVLVDVERLE